MTKVMVNDRSEAVGLIAQGVNSMLIFSPEAPYGYKKDGTPAGKRGRKALADSVKQARALKSAASGRAKTGPVVRTPDAPYGVKKDGTPMQKRGRPRKDAAPMVRVSVPTQTEVALAVPSSASNQVVQPVPAQAPTQNETIPELSLIGSDEPELTVEISDEPVVVPTIRANAEVIQDSDMAPGTRVRLVESVCSGDQTRFMVGTIVKNADSQLFVSWDDGKADYRAPAVLEAIQEKNVRHAAE